MRVLGIITTSRDVSWALIEGTKSSPVAIPLGSTKHKYPKGKCESDLLRDLYMFAPSLLQDNEVDKIAIVQAGTATYGKISLIRIKVEAVFQIVAAEYNKPIKIIHPSAFNAQIKKFKSVVGNTPEVVLNAGEEFMPKTWKDAVLIAWMGLEQ